MIKILIFVVKRAGMSREEFRAYYENNHVALSMKYFGHLFLEFRRNYPGLSAAYIDRENGNSLRQGYDAGCAYDAVTEVVVADQAALQELIEILNDPEIAPLVRDDEEMFTDRCASRMCIAEVCDGGRQITSPVS